MSSEPQANSLFGPVPEPPPSFYKARAKEYVELHNQVATSVTLLDTLETFLSTFQTDLSAVAGQISELQDRSTDIDGKLRNRRRIEKPLSGLISSLTIPPPLAIVILDTPVGEPWLAAIPDFEQRLTSALARNRVRAARDIGEVSEGLRIVAATKLRAFFLALFQPIRTAVTTNMQVIQTSILLKYASLYTFLDRQAPTVAQEVQRNYIASARVYYETGFRRYARSLGWIKSRTTEKFENIVASEKAKDIGFSTDRLQYAKIDGPGVTLAFMADDKTHKEPIEALLRSLLLVFMDNATAEYTFVDSFFATSTTPSTAEKGVVSPTAELAPTPAPDTGFVEARSTAESESGAVHAANTGQGITDSVGASGKSKEDQAAVERIWKQIMDPVLTYCETFVKGVVDPMPGSTTLLTMIRLTEDVGTEVQRRRCPGVERFIYRVRLDLWPVFQRGMADHVESLRKLAEGSGSGYFGRGATTTDITVSNICKRYVEMFNAFVFLTEHEEETMIFTNLVRLRQELYKLIERHAGRMRDVTERTRSQVELYGLVLAGLREGSLKVAHVKTQQEIAFWGRLVEDGKRRAGH